MKNVKAFLDGRPLEFSLCNNDFFVGEDIVLADREKDILGQNEWYRSGYTIAPIFEKNEFEPLKASIEKRLIQILRDFGIEISEQFGLKNYHKVVSDDQHEMVIRQTRNINFESLEFDFDGCVQRVSNICGFPLSLKNSKLDKDFVIVRISRPHRDDFNPPHKDGYLDVWERTVNLWIPVDGCSSLSNLGIMPGSHLMPESQIVRTSGGAQYNGKKYHVPAIVSCQNKDIHFIRPDVPYGSALIFSPLLIHGCAVNFSNDETRVSLEGRVNG